ncbi:MAG: hypothetical protein AB1345_14205 [Chloroflexota bacterium]
MKRYTILILVFVLLSQACSPGDLTGRELPTAGNPPVSGQPCGDGVCEGPENAANCPADCAGKAPWMEPLSVCDLPNPPRAVVSAELLEFRNVYADNSFEEGLAEVVILPHVDSQLAMASVTRSPAAARSGAWGYQIEAGPGQGAMFSAKAYIEKGQELHFSVWVRAPFGRLSLTPQVFWVENENDLGVPTRGETVAVGQEWTHIELKLSTTIGARYALLAFEVGPESMLYIDDVEIAVPYWHMAEYPAGQGRVVGGVNVPAEPIAPTHFNIVIHIEDPNLLQTSRAYFEEQTAIFIELARIIYQHGGFLTIQPEQDWPQAAEGGFHPGLLAELAQNFGVVYSNHTHGPNCLDPQGVSHSSADCNSHPDWPRAYDNDDIVAYARAMRELLSAASGTQVTDHNGNFDFTATSRFAEAGIQTLSVFKDRTTQSSYDYLYNNPWRPGQVNALEDIMGFLTHDHVTQIVYIPGWGQALTQHPQRVIELIRPMLSQFIRFADPQRVNSFYVITHVGHFYSRSGDPNYLKYNQQTGRADYSLEFLQHLGYWEAMLSEVIDPLVEAGYLQWTSIPDIGGLYREWEAACGEK